MSRLLLDVFKNWSNTKRSFIVLFVIIELFVILYLWNFCFILLFLLSVHVVICDVYHYFKNRINREEHEINYQDLVLRNMEQWIYEVVCPNLARQKREFFAQIKGVLDPLIESGKQQKKFNWAAVRSFYNALRDDLDNIWTLKMCCGFVLKLFCTFDCEDDLFIKQIIYIYCQVLNEYKSLGVCPNCLRLSHPKHYFYEELEDCVCILSTVNEPPPHIYRFSNREMYSKLTIDAIYEGDYVFMQFLIKYGLNCFPCDSLFQLRVELKKLYDKYRQFNIIGGNNVEMAETNDFVEGILQQLLAVVTTDRGSKIRRILLILKYVHICFHKRLGDGYYPDYVNCLNLYVLTVPETVVSVNDIEYFLNLAFIHDGIFITEMRSNFSELFPENPSFSSPTGLKHLCRCKVRDCIRNSASTTLPGVISKMRIPSALKSYLFILSD